MNHWSKNIWESRTIILKRFRFHPRVETLLKPKKEDAKEEGTKTEEY